VVTKRKITKNPEESLARRIQEACVVTKVTRHIVKKRRSHATMQVPMQARAQSTIDQILVSATKLLLREGYESFNTNRIAAEADISVATLYQYFDDKTAIIGSLIEGQSVRLIAALESSVADYAHLPIQDAIAEIISVMFKTYRDETRLFGLIRDHVPYGEHADLTEAAMQRIVDIVTFALRTRAREINLIDHQAVAFIIVYAIDGVIAAALNKKMSDMEYQNLSKVAAGMVQALLRSQTVEV